MKSKSVMEPRFIWLLTAMCEECGVDPQYIDFQLTYYENKQSIEEQFGIKLRLKNAKDEIDYEAWESQLEWFNDQVGVKKGKKADKKVPVDIGNILRASIKTGD